MPLTTVACTGSFYEQDGTALVSATVTATLDMVDYDASNYAVTPLPVTATTDANGLATLNLWPNALGTLGSKYRFTCFHPVTGDTILNGLATVPNTASNIFTLLEAG